ncbi:MAG: S24 family peptidase [Burkholderiaceae bacterium]|nr:S24 family peptidase [Burkholderiaceae bacterium]
MDPILETIDTALKRKGLTDAAASKLAVGHPSLIKNLRMPRAGEKRYNFPALAKLAEVLDLELYFGPRREADPIEQVILSSKAYVPIALHAAELAAGAGAENGDAEVIDYLVFRRDWLRKIGVPAASARLARVRGESMLPTLSPGDMVMIDTARTTVPVRPRQPERPLRADLYAVFESGGARVKRVEHSTPGELWLHSDNTALRLPPERRTGFDAEQLGIIGKVVWWGHTEVG